MYEAALNQAYSLCSFSGVGYDGQPSGASGVNGGTDTTHGHHYVSTIRVRIYWCKWHITFVGTSADYVQTRLCTRASPRASRAVDSISMMAIWRLSRTRSTIVRWSSTRSTSARPSRWRRRRLTLRWVQDETSQAKSQLMDLK
jgi:hypothetical protein